MHGMSVMYGMYGMCVMYGMYGMYVVYGPVYCIYGFRGSRINDSRAPSATRDSLVNTASCPISEHDVLGVGLRPIEL